MSNNAPDYENNLAFPPQEIKSQDDIKHQDTRSSDVLIKAVEKCEKLEKQLKIAVDMLKRINMYSLASNDDVDDQVADIFNWSGDAITQIEDLDK
jgi:hypothetical protein